METDWAGLGEALKAARLALRPKPTQADVAQTLGVSRATVQNIEQGKALTRVNATIRAYAQLVGWTPDSPERVLAGGSPVKAGASAAEPACRPEAEGLPLTVQEELEREGALVDTAVVQLPDGTSVTVIVKGASKSPTPEKRQRNHEARHREQPKQREQTKPTDRDSA